MRLSFLARRALQVFALVFALLAVIELAEGERLEDALAYAALWGVASATAFALIQRIRIRRGTSCEVCEGARAEELSEEDDDERTSVQHT